MNPMSIPRQTTCRGTRRAALAALVLLTPIALAQAQFMVVGNDEKEWWDDTGKQINRAPGKDTIDIYDIKAPATPKLLTALQLENKIYVIDLKAAPPKLISTVEAGKQPSGMAINRKGDLALVANRADNTVSVLSIAGKDVKLIDTVAMGDSVAAVAITPDGKHAVAVKNTANRVAWLDIDGQKVTYNKYDMIVGNFPYNVEIVPDGKIAIVNNNGKGLLLS